MKKLMLAFWAIAGIGVAASAQRYENIKNLLLLSQTAKAKEEVEKNWSNAKFIAKPEAYILKSAVLSTMAKDAEKKEDGFTIINEAEQLFQDYLQKDPGKSLLKDEVYRNVPLNLYYVFFNRGISKYNGKEYQDAYKDFEKVLYFSEFMNNNGIIEVPLDTNAILLAGASAQGADMKEETRKHFGRLADAKVGGEENEFLYKYMARDAFDREDIAGFEKYMSYGRELYPNEEWYTFKEEDFVLSIEDEAEKLRRIEGLMAKDPNNYKVQAVFGEIMFEKLNPRDNNDPLPENAAELEAKMVAAFNKAAELEPSSPASYMNLANHFLNKSIRTQNELSAHQRMMRDKQRENTPPAVKGKPAPKPPAPDPADVEKRKALQAQYEKEIDEARGYYEKSLDIYTKMEELKGIDKQNMRNAINYLIDIYKDLKDAAGRDKRTADENKFAAGEKKYMDMYSKLNK